MPFPSVILPSLPSVTLALSPLLPLAGGVHDHRPVTDLSFREARITHQFSDNTVGFSDFLADNIEFLRSLPEGSGERVALHREVGEITLAQMLHEWAMHDLGHIRQIAELVRARKHLAGAGELGKSYDLKP